MPSSSTVVTVAAVCSHAMGSVAESAMEMGRALPKSDCATNPKVVCAFLESFVEHLVFFDCRAPGRRTPDMLPLSRPAGTVCKIVSPQLSPQLFWG